MWGGAPPAQPGVPSPTTAVRGAGRESPTTHPGGTAPSVLSPGTAQECGCLLTTTAPTKRWGGEEQPPGTCLGHSLCPCVPIPGWCDGMAWHSMARRGMDRQLLPWAAAHPAAVQPCSWHQDQADEDRDLSPGC